MLVEPESLIDVRPKPEAHETLDYLIKWKNLPPFEATLENYQFLGSRTRSPTQLELITLFTWIFAAFVFGMGILGFVVYFSVRP
ncbi:hypothetical protein CsatB_027142 [Cannabis sativa]